MQGQGRAAVGVSDSACAASARDSKLVVRYFRSGRGYESFATAFSKRSYARQSVVDQHDFSTFPPSGDGSYDPKRSLRLYSLNGIVVKRCAVLFSRRATVLQLFIGGNDHGVDLGRALGIADLVQHFRLLDQTTEPCEDTQMHGLVGGTDQKEDCLLYTSPSPRDATLSRMPSSA